MTSECGKNKEVADKPQASVSLMFLPHFLHPLRSITEETHGIYLFYTMIRKKKTDTHTFLIPLDCSKICASLGKTANSSLIAMTHDGNCCEDFLNFRHS